MQRLILLTGSLLALTLGLFSPAFAQNEQREFFPETGHWVSGDFLTKYLEATDPEAIYGYPITEAFLNKTTGRQVQYFERAYFELHPENPPELRVELSRLGEILVKKGEPLRIPGSLPACQTFTDTGYQVCYAFLDFFNQNGGIAQFGYPITDLQILNGRMVQYFQRAAFEWHPELASGKRVMLSDLGRQYFEERKEDQSRIPPPKGGDIIQDVLELKIRAFPAVAVMPPQGRQILYVIVQDQSLQPVSGTTVTLYVRYPSGEAASFPMPPTDGNGITTYPFGVDERDQGMVEITVEATYNELTKTTRASFRIWW